MSPTGDDVALTTLLSWAWAAFVIEADNTVEASAPERARRLFRISLAMWANGLRLVDEDGTTVGDVRAAAGAVCNIGGLERWGWVSVGGSGDHRRNGYGTNRGLTLETVLRPTRAGVYARRVWPRAIEDVEQRWRRRFGPGAIDALGACITGHLTGMPWAPPEVHSADGFFTHVVERRPADDGAPLVARLGQALTALTIDNERGAGASLPVAANVLRVVADRGVRARDLPRQAGISKEAAAMAVNFVERQRLCEVGADRLLSLTGTGRVALDNYRATATASDDADLRAALGGIVSRRDALAQGLVAPSGSWRSQAPYAAQTRRLVDDPTAALPWHPMVLHRGGWPDGS